MPKSPTRAVQLGDDGLEGAKLDNVASGLGTLSDGAAFADLFVTGVDGYFRDPAEAWGSIGDIGGCIQRHGEEVAKAGR